MSKKYKIYNSDSYYEVEVDKNGIVIASSYRPNKRQHWVVGCEFYFLINYYKRKYYKEPTELERLTEFHIEKIKE